jgi:hypothetical protein
MQTTQKDLEIRADMPEDGKARRIQMPERNTLIVAGAITGGAVAAGLVMFYYLRKRRMAH